ncbi:MAG: nicotinate phosphoribosyltransferase [Candidatus Spyradocola sp.]|jgi:nicotinate phosphoribosyltransferase
MRNLTMLTDLYQMTMMNGYIKAGITDRVAVFDLFYRKNPGNAAFAVAAGLEQVIDYIENLHFDADDIQYLRSLNLFDERFFDYIRDFHFTGEIYAVPEGTVVFPYEPLIRVKAPIFEAQLIETAMLNIVNHQTLIASKAARVCQAAQGDLVMEFGLRRAQGPDAGLYGARAALIAGCGSTSNVLAGKMFDVPVAGTHAHSWVMSFPDELTAFRAYADAYPDACLLLVDTYDTLGSGMPNAIRVFHELREKGHEPLGVRLDSGDLAYLSRQARRMLDEAGFPNAKICASGDLDEDVIWDLKQQGACIDSWGVGTRMITSDGCPALGGVYKMSAEIVNGKVVPKIKISENPSKVTNPGIKKVKRIYNREGMAMADLILLEDEQIDPSKPLTIFHPVDTWKQQTYTEYTLRDLLVPVFVDGKCVYERPTLKQIQAYCKNEISTLWEQYRRRLNPHVYKVDLSYELYVLRHKLLNQARTEVTDLPKLQ